MTQSEFLKKLNRELRGLPQADREDALEYYREYFYELGLGPNDDVTGRVSAPEECARTILADLLVKQEDQRSVKSGVKTAWLVVLGVLASPAALPLAIAAAVLVGAVFAVLGALFLAGVGVALAGLLLIPAAFLSFDAGQALVVMGVGFVMLPVGFGLCWCVSRLWGALARMIANLWRGKEKENE